MSIRRAIESTAATGFVSCALWFGAVQTGAAQTGVTKSLSGPSTDQQLEQLLEQKLQFEAFGWPAEGHFPNQSPLLEQYIDFNRRIWDDYRFSWMLAPTLMYQVGTQGGNNSQTANFQYSLMLYWRPFENTSWGTGQMVFNSLQVIQLTSTTGVDLTQSLGIKYPISDSVGDSNSVKALYWQQDFPEDVGYLRLGHIELAGSVLSCSYACDDTQSFITAPLAGNAASTMSGQGWGLQAGVNLGTKLKLEFGVADGNGDGTLRSPGSLDSSELAYTAVASLNDFAPDLGAGAIRIGTYYVDPLKQGTPGAQDSTRGIVINAEQAVGDVGLFARYTQASRRLAALERTAAIGAVWTNPFGNSEDWLGFGLGYVQPAAADSKDEFLAETYYRFQLTPLTQFTVGAVVLDRPNNAGSTGVEAVFNLRLRAHF